MIQKVLFYIPIKYLFPNILFNNKLFLSNCQFDKQKYDLILDLTSIFLITSEANMNGHLFF